MTDLQILESYRATTLEMIAIREQMARTGLTGSPDGIAVQAYDAHRHTNDRTAAAMQTLDGLDAALQQRMHTLTEIVARFEDILARVGSLHAVVLRRYYGLGETDAQVGAALGYSERRINQLRNNVITELL